MARNKPAARNRPALDVEAALQRAVGHHSAGRLPEAGEVYDAILAVQPRQPDALHLRGILAAQAEQFEMAAELIRRAISVNRSVADFHNSLGQVLKAQGQFEPALASFRAALELRRDHAEAWCNLGVAQYGAGAAAEADTSLARALELNRNIAEALAARACIAFEERNFAIASEALTRAAGCDPNFAWGPVCLVGDEFDRATDPAGLARALRDASPLEGETPGPGDAMVVTTACDHGYFVKFGQALIRSVDRNAPGHDFHLHLVNPAPSFEGEIAALRSGLRGTTLTVSWERAPEAERIYFSAMRFVRLHQLVEASGRAFLGLDTDSLVRGALGGVAQGDLSITTRYHLPFLNQKVLATSVYIGATPAAREFMRRLAGYIMSCLASRRLAWYIDQCAFYITHRMMEFAGQGVALAPLDKSFADDGLDPASMIWAAKGDRKTAPAFADELAKYQA